MSSCSGGAAVKVKETTMKWLRLSPSILSGDRRQEKLAAGISNNSVCCPVSKERSEMKSHGIPFGMFSLFCIRSSNNVYRQHHLLEGRKHQAFQWCHCLQLPYNEKYMGQQQVWQENGRVLVMENRSNICLLLKTGRCALKSVSLRIRLSL